jgi:hypothetical protein
VSDPLPSANLPYLRCRACRTIHVAVTAKGYGELKEAHRDDTGCDGGYEEIREFSP